MDALGQAGTFSLRLLLFRALSLSMEWVGFFIFISTYIKLDFKSRYSRTFTVESMLLNVLFFLIQ